MAKKRKKRNRVVSLRFKTVAVIFFAALVLTVIAVTISYRSYSKTMDDHYKTLASNLAKTAATQLDTDALLRYYDEVKKIGVYDEDKYWEDEEYKAEYDAKADAIKDDAYYEMLDMLFDIKDSNDILYIYVQKLDEGNKTCTYLFDADRAEDRCQLGTTHAVSASTNETSNPEYGVPAFISNETYGWLCTAVEPVMNKDGTPVALVGVDISMDDIMQDRTYFLYNIIIIMAIAAIAIIVLIWIAVNSSLVKNINELSKATRFFVERRNKSEQHESVISKLNIHSGDEVETLFNSIKTMEHDINDYIENLTAVTAEKERIGAELELATRIQADMLPNIFPAFPEREDFDIYASMTPAKEVGGDFYDFFLIDDTHLAMVMADVSGKGVPAALFMMMSKILIQNEAMSGKSPAETLTAVNDQICANNREEMFVTVWLGIINLKSGLLTASNAGHEKPIVKHADGSFETFSDKHGFVIGGMSGMKYKDYEIQLEKGSKLFVYTDGVAEATSADDELFGIERTVEALNSAMNEEPKAIIEKVKENVDLFVGEAPQFDDLTMLCFELIGSDENSNCDEITIDATLENVPLATEFVSEKADTLPFSTKDKYQIDVAVDEIVSNVARYAYEGKEGKVTIRTETDDQSLTITVIDSGIPYNPLEKEDPDVTLSADERGVGGYGIFIVKKVMDEVTYEYRDGKNILTMKENI